MAELMRRSETDGVGRRPLEPREPPIPKPQRAELLPKVATASLSLRQVGDRKRRGRSSVTRIAARPCMWPLPVCESIRSVGLAKGRRPTALRRQIIGDLRRRTIDISQPIRVVTVRYRGIPFAQAARRFGGSIAVLAGAAALTGCTSGPDFVRPDKPKEQGYTPENLVPQTAASAVSNGGAAQTFVPTEDIPGEWWKLFRSSELNALIDEALKANPDLDAAQASLRQANEALYAQQGTLFPTISANGSAQQLRASGVQQGGSVDTQLLYGVTTGTLNISYNLDVWGGVCGYVWSAGSPGADAASAGQCSGGKTAVTFSIL